MPIADPDKLRPKLEKDGVEEVKNKLARGAYAKFKAPIVKEWLQEKEQNEQTLEPKPPKFLQNIKWLELHWKQYLKYIIVAVVVLLIIFIINKVNLFDKSSESKKTTINKVEGDYVGRDKNIIISPPERKVSSVECDKQGSKISCPLKLTAYRNEEPHYHGSLFGEIKWNEKDVDVRVLFINKSGRTIHDINLVIESETYIREIRQLTQISDVSFTPYSRLFGGHQYGSLIIKDKEGKEHMQPFNVYGFRGPKAYQVICPKLLNNSYIEIIMANIGWEYNKEKTKIWPIRKLPKWTRIHGTYATTDINSQITYQLNSEISLQRGKKK